MFVMNVNDLVTKHREPRENGGLGGVGFAWRSVILSEVHRSGSGWLAMLKLRGARDGRGNPRMHVESFSSEENALALAEKFATQQAETLESERMTG